VGKTLNANGEGITYIGWDNSEDSIVEIREYFPKGNATRNPDKTVSIIKGCEYNFNGGLMDFIEINKTLMAMQNPLLEKVTAVFEENGTVYAIFKSVTSITLREFLTRNGGTLKWEQAKPLFLGLIDAVKELHDAGIIHRGISTETVLVGRDGKLHLTGISVKGIRKANTGFAAQLYPGYAAAEQYGREDLHDDKYTDVYGICATIFRTLVGAVPPEASARLENDGMTVPAKAAEEIPVNVLTALANGLQVMPYDRTQDIDSLKSELLRVDTSDINIAEQAKKADVAVVSAQSESGKDKKGSSAKYAVISAACTVLVFLVLALILGLTVFKDQFFPSKDNSVSQGSDEISSIPSVASIGSVDSNAYEDVKLYSVPDVSGKYFSEISGDEENEEYNKFDFVIKGKEYSDKYVKGTIISQTVAPGTNVEKGTTVEVIISLGAKQIKIANVVGLDETEAKMELLKQGFLYDNIEVIQKYNPDKKPGIIIEQEPKYGSSINTEMVVKIYINSYTGEDDSGYTEE
ncbi:MAG: PASTA domain-containing protein, partial [Clostridia bacterium]|nr:PASTA domain-containing protein [Clostridia bacterium]